MKVGKDFKRRCGRELHPTDGGGLRGCENLGYVVRMQFIYAF
jgi:hypothetical protein